MPSRPCFSLNAFCASENGDAFIVLRSSPSLGKRPENSHPKWSNFQGSEHFCSLAGGCNGTGREALDRAQRPVPLLFESSARSAEHRRRQPAQPAVRPYGVIVDAPSLDDSPSLGERGEDVFVEAFVAQPAVERFDEAALGRLAGRNVVTFDAMVLLPPEDGSRGQFGAVVTDQQAGRSRLSTMRSSSRATRVAGVLAPLQVPKMPLAAGWLHEIKYDGYRMHARIDGGDITLLTRKGLDCTIE
jgi:hypothetical protein